MLAGKSAAAGAGLGGSGSRMLASSSAVPARMTGLAEKAGRALGEAVAEGVEEVLREREDVLASLARAEGVGMGVMTVSVALGVMVGLRERVSVDRGVISVTVALGETEALKLAEVELLSEERSLEEDTRLAEGEPEGLALALLKGETLVEREDVRETLGVREETVVKEGLVEGLSREVWVRVTVSVPESEALLDREGLPEPLGERELLRLRLPEPLRVGEWLGLPETLKEDTGVGARVWLPEAQKEGRGEGEGVCEPEGVAAPVPR